MHNLGIKKRYYLHLHCINIVLTSSEGLKHLNQNKSYWNTGAFKVQYKNINVFKVSYKIPVCFTESYKLPVVQGIIYGITKYQRVLKYLNQNKSYWNTIAFKVQYKNINASKVSYKIPVCSKESYKLPVGQGIVYGITKYQCMKYILLHCKKTIKWKINYIYKGMKMDQIYLCSHLVLNTCIGRKKTRGDS